MMKGKLSQQNEQDKWKNNSFMLKVKHTENTRNIASSSREKLWWKCKEYFQDMREKLMNALEKKQNNTKSIQKMCLDGFIRESLFEEKEEDKQNIQFWKKNWSNLSR